MINAKLDDEWAISIFSKDVHLLATGVYKLDDILKGGFRAFKRHGVGVGVGVGFGREPVSVVLQGRPGSGKTTTALLILCNFASQGYTSFYLSAEQRVESLVRTIQRFCVKVEEVKLSSRSLLFHCELREQPSTDATKETERQFRRLNEDQRLASGVRAFIKKQSRIYTTRQNKFFVAVVSPSDWEQSDVGFKSKIKELYANSIHGIVLSTVSLPDEDEDMKEIGPGPVYGPTPKQFFDYYRTFKENWPEAPSWLVLDSVTAFQNAASRTMSALFQQKEPHLSRLMLTENVSMRDTSPNDLETSCDILIELGERNLQVASVADSPSNYMQRYLEIKKLRSSPFHRGKHPMAIKSGTVKVFRSIAILMKVTGNLRRVPLSMRDDHELMFGVDGLDGPRGLNRSMSRGSFTVLQGPPGCYKTAMCSYFLTADQRHRGGKKKGRSLWYSFAADRRAVINGMRNFVDENGDIFKDTMLVQEGGLRPRMEIQDLRPGYLFPETFVEDLLDILSKFNAPGAVEGDQVTRIVFDSFDAIQAVYPIMRMDQFFWRVVSQICWDYRVSALLKVSHTLFPGHITSEMAGVLSGIADNVIEVNSDGRLKIVASEHRIHTNSLLQVEPTIIRKDVRTPAKVWLRVKA